MGLLALTPSDERHRPITLTGMSSKSPFIGSASGMTRMVILLGPWALKFPNALRAWPMFLSELLANMTEAAWRSVAAVENGLCPLLFAVPGGRVVGRSTPCARNDRVGVLRLQLRRVHQPRMPTDCR